MTSIQIPASLSTVQVSIIDTTVRMRKVPVSFFAGPDIKGFETFAACAFAFLITHTDPSTGQERHILFDLGPPKDWENDLSKPTADTIKVWGAEIKMEKYVSEILEENGVPLKSLEAVVWSHPHWDHTGRISLFPLNVALMTGPGVKSALYPGYPANPNSPVLERDFAGREVKELEFGVSSLTLGSFKAIDYFGDGSFYFISAPGHAVGHVNALARTTSGQGSEPTFILMGADSYHHSSQLRPSAYTPLPDNIPGPLANFPDFSGVCPGHIFDTIHPSHPNRMKEHPAHYKDDVATNHSDPRKTPYLTISSIADGHTLAVDLQEAKQTIKGLQEFDGEENILMVAAHDMTLLDVMEYFPEKANDWKAKGWKEKGKWRFLGDFDEALKAAAADAA